MVANIIHGIRRKKILCFVALGMLFLCSFNDVYSQEMPPRPVAIAFTQNLNFGAFSPGLSGGTVTVSANGIRYSTGSVILVGQGYLYFPAIFGLEGNPGTIVHLINGPDEILTGSNGGSMTLQLGNSSAGDPIIITAAPPEAMQIMVGGTLLVGNSLANPAGYYTGSFTVMIIQE